LSDKWYYPNSAPIIEPYVNVLPGGEKIQFAIVKNTNGEYTHYSSAYDINNISNLRVYKIT
jgi:hypothetical protein